MMFEVSEKGKMAIRKFGHHVVRIHNKNNVTSIWPYACAVLLKVISVIVLSFWHAFCVCSDVRLFERDKKGIINSWSRFRQLKVTLLLLFHAFHRDSSAHESQHVLHINLRTSNSQRRNCERFLSQSHFTIVPVEESSS